MIFMTELISEDIKNWVAQKIKQQTNSTEFVLVPLAGDASARRYYRVIQDEKTSEKTSEKTWVLMLWVPFSQAEYPFLSVQRHFSACHVQVPEIIAIGEALGALLLEDLGDLTLERKFWESAKSESSEEFYLKTIDELIKIHDVTTYSAIKSTASVTKFDPAKFLWEMNYAKENLLLELLNVKLNAADAAELNSAFVNFCTLLAEKPKVICHRDFHSRNVMLKRNKVIIIDFQDARLGPVQYDLVSLFKDSYVDIDDAYATKLMNYYLQNSNIKKTRNFSEEDFFKTYELQSLQRCFKACGSFASFMNQRRDTRYLKYLAPTLRRVFKALAHFPEYSILNKILIDAGALEKKFESLS